MALPAQVAGSKILITSNRTRPVPKPTFEQALQSVGLLDEWLEYSANQPGQ